MASIQTGTWKDLKDAKEQLGLGEPPPSGLVPIGDTGLYTTPDEPADPRDCDRYPSSPYCGGNPFSKTPVGLDISTTIDAQPCGVSRSVTLEPTLGFIKLPPVTAAYIPENCREEYEQRNSKAPPPPPKTELDGYEPTPQHRPYGYGVNDIVCVVTVDHYTNQERVFNNTSKKWGVAFSSISGSLEKTYYPSADQIPLAESNTGALGTAVVTVKGKANYVEDIDGEWTSIYWRDPNGYFNSSEESLFIGIPPDLKSFGEIYGIPPIPQNQFQYRTAWAYPTGYGGVKTLAVWVGRLGAIFPNQQISPLSNVFYEETTYTRRTIHERFIVYCEKIDPGGTPGRRPPPPKPPKKHCCEDDMGCCQPTSNNKQDQDLSEIKKMLRELKKAIGVDEYPVKMPALLNADYNDKGKKSEPGTVSEDNLTKVIGRFIRYFDGVMGEWGIGFKVADADPTKPGDQPKFIHAPNLAELSAEMYSHIFDMWIMQYQLMHLHQRASTETMLGRKVGIQNYFHLEAIVDFLGFKRKEETKDVPFLFDLDAEKFEDYLKNKNQKIQILHFEPDDENSKSLPDMFLRINRMAAMYEARHARRFNPNSDVAKGVLDILKSYSERTEKVNSGKVSDNNPEEEFDQWLRDAEDAFINRTGQGDPSKPYGVPYSERPRLTKIQDSLEGGTQ